MREGMRRFNEAAWCTVAQDRHPRRAMPCRVAQRTLFGQIVFYCRVRQSTAILVTDAIVHTCGRRVAGAQRDRSGTAERCCAASPVRSRSSKFPKEYGTTFDRAWPKLPRQSPRTTTLGREACAYIHVGRGRCCSPVASCRNKRGRQPSQTEPNAGTWKTWVISGQQFRVPSPPDSAATDKELTELSGWSPSRDQTSLAQYCLLGHRIAILSVERDRADRYHQNAICHRRGGRAISRS